MTRGKARAAFLVIVFGMIAGIGAMVIGVENYSLAGKTKSQPQTLTATQLLQRGPGDNSYVRLTDVIPRVDAIVVEGGDHKTYWETAYIPLVPSAPETTADDDAPQIILITKSVKDTAGLEALAKSGSIEGVLGAWDGVLDQESRDLLHKNYSKMDAAKCYLLSHDATPPSKAGSMVCMGVGVVLLVGIVLMGITARRQKWGEALKSSPTNSFGVAPLAPYPTAVPPLTSLPTGSPKPPPLPRSPAYRT
jgi:hypothetical protein